MVKIKIIVPITLEEFKRRAEEEFRYYLEKGMSKDVEVDVEILEEGKGPQTIECEYDTAYAIPGAVDLIKKAEKDGYDGVYIDCFCDAGLRPGREAVNIPVVGAFESTMALSIILGQRISVVTIKKELIPRLYNMTMALGLQEKIVSIRAIEIPVAELGDKERVEKALLKEMTEAIEKDGAHVLVLGCTGMMGVAADVQKMLYQKGYDVPVVSPAEVGFRVMESLLTIGIKQSKLTFMTPPKKEV